MISLVWGSDQQQILNSNCQLINLVHHIKSICGVSKNVEIDLAEEATGQLQFLTEASKKVDDLRKKTNCYSDIFA